VLNGALEALDVDSRQRIRTLLLSQPAGIGLINIGPESGDDALYTVRLHLVSDPQARNFNLSEARAASIP
jgi:ABC-type uncharacterized transport system fused permease/ATPase subunit